MRIIAATRLSRDTDTSTSIERQREAIERYASQHGHKIIAVTEDTDVSGSVSPFDRPDLGGWFANGKVAQWDAIAVAKLDRISRSIVDFGTLLKWCEEHGKVIICLEPNFDMSTPFGRAIANILMTFAQFEREMTGIRVKDSRAKLRSLAWWGGASIPPGYRVVKFDDHNELEPEPEQADLIRRIADLIISGTSARQIAATLNSEGITTVNGHRWDSGSLLKIMRNQSLRGYVLHNDEVVRGDDGLPVQRTPILDDDTWVKVQAQLEKNSHPGSGIRKGAGLLTGLIYCAECGEHLYYHRRTAGDRFRHSDKSECKMTYGAKSVEQTAQEHILAYCADLPMMIKTEIPAQDHTVELARVQQSIDELDESFERGSVSAESYGRMTTKLEARRDVLEALPVSEAREDWTETGEMFTDHYSALDVAGRHALMLDFGVRVDVSRGLTLPNLKVMTMDEIGESAIMTYLSGKNTVTVDAGKWAELRDRARAA